MTAKTKTSAGLGARHDRTVQEYQHDTYKLREKLKEPTTCTECGAVFHKGRVNWARSQQTPMKSSAPLV